MERITGEQPNDNQYQQGTENTTVIQSESPSKFYNPNQLFSLLRLSHIIKVREDLIKDSISPKDWRLRLANKALYSTYIDCNREGVVSDARSLLGNANLRPK